MSSLVARRAIRRSLPRLVLVPGRGGIRRIFNNDQILDRFDEWLMVCGKAANTRLGYACAARQFGRFLDRPLTSATKEDLRAFMATLYAKQLAPGTLQKRLDALRVLFDCLQLGGQVRANIPRYISRRKLPTRLAHVKSEEEIEQLIDAARTPRDRAIFELGYAAALRISELNHLNVEDLNLRGRTLIVRRGKGGNDRLGLFGIKAAGALREYLKGRDSGPLFVRQRQRSGVSHDHHGAWWGFFQETAPASQCRLSTKGIYRIIVDTAKRAGISGVHPHILRHSCATHCLNRGMDIRFVHEILGHTSVSATQKYLHLATEQLKRVHASCFPEG